MMRLLLLLCACAGVGLSYDREELYYGNTYKIRVPYRTNTIEFIPSHVSEVIVLWKRNEPRYSQDNRRRMTGSYFVISNVTQKDSGKYKLRSESRLELTSSYLNVVEFVDSYLREVGETLTISYNLEPDSCNIYFIPIPDYEHFDIVRDGMLQPEYSECKGFRLQKPCGIFHDNLQKSCRGRFEIIDSDDNKALVVSVDVEAPAFEKSYLGIGAGVLISVFCTCCLKCCCRKKSSSEKESSEAAADDGNNDNENEPAVHYHEYDNEPVGLRQNQPHEPSWTQYPAQPSYTPAATPLIHNPPTEPPAYFESVPLPKLAGAPTVPLYSDSEPRFEVKGMNFNSAAPLSSDSARSDVYTSDKLNFL